MGFKEIQDLDCDKTTALGGKNKATGKSNPTKVEGYFIGSKDTPSRKSKNGIAKLHIFQTAQGRLGVWGKTDLDRKLAGVAAGSMTRVTQSGMVPTPNGDMYKFKVEVDNDNTIEVNLPPVTTQDSDDSDDSANFEAADDTGYEEAEEESGLEADEQPVDEAPPARAVAPKKAATVDAERKAKVQRLLGGGGKSAA